jgi:DNA repair protein RecN (Recombination protein N)
VLSELRVENLLLIEQAQLRLAPGLNVLTGETGAGKTILAHALDLLLGGRARPGIVRPGAAEAYVEGVFSLSERMRSELGDRLPAACARADHDCDHDHDHDHDHDDCDAAAEDLVLARRVSADGRTRAYLNGRAATVGDLRELGGSLIAFYGQHEHRKLVLSAAQLHILDEFCGAEQLLRRDACAEAFRECHRLESELEGVRELMDARERELELLEHELAEIDALAPEESEHRELLAGRERLRRLDALRLAACSGAQALSSESSSPEDPVASRLVAGATAQLDALAGVDPELDAIAVRLRSLAIETEDLSGALRGYVESIEEENEHNGSLEAVEERLAALERLMRKHGGTIASVQEHAVQARVRRDELAGVEVAHELLTERLQRASAVLNERVEALRKARALAAPRLASTVREQLADLAMPDATFEIELSRRDPGPQGGDGVQFMIAPNPGVPPGPLRDIASGGELSRVMLALSAVCIGADGRANDGEDDASSSSSDLILVFDEVDAGIGGHTARAVGERLRSLGEARQVLCITHLPQIASLGARHFSVVKDTSATPTRASVVQLGEPEEVVSELVRMLGADDGDATARRHARELRRAA